MTQPLAYHPLANIFPLIEGEEFDALVADVRANGLRENIMLLDGQILDGRNRYRAALAVGLLEPERRDSGYFRKFNPEKCDRGGDGDPLAYVLSKNLARRHLNESQRASVAAKLSNMPRHRPADKSANLQTSQAEAAKHLNVSPRLLASAKTVQDKGSEDLNKAMDAGRIPASVAAKAAKLSPEQQRQVVDEVAAGRVNVVRTVIKRAERSGRERDLGIKQQALPDKKFGIILADPEHRFDVYSRETGLDRAADNHYPTTEQRLLLMREVEKIAAKDAMCVLWITDLARGIRMLESWGFAFKSYRVWAKDIIEGPRDDQGRKTFVQIGPAGTGYWFRDRDELVLIGTRGNFVAPAMGTQPESILFASRPKVEGTKRGRHSAKPDDIHLWIEANWPNTPKIELNARARRPGWDVWGNEVSPDLPTHDPETGEIFEDEIPEPAATDDAAEILPEPLSGDEGGNAAEEVNAGVKLAAPEPQQRAGSSPAAEPMTIPAFLVRKRETEDTP